MLVFGTCGKAEKLTSEENDNPVMSAPARHKEKLEKQKLSLPKIGWLFSTVNLIGWSLTGVHSRPAFWASSDPVTLKVNSAHHREAQLPSTRVFMNEYKNLPL